MQAMLTAKIADFVCVAPDLNVVGSPLEAAAQNASASGSVGLGPGGSWQCLWVRVDAACRGGVSGGSGVWQVVGSAGLGRAMHAA